ncbi:MAG: SAM-dependent methyltransferase [Chitinophagales bacterium]
MLYLIPSFLGEDNPAIISDQAKLAIQQLDCFVVENAKTARRFLRAIGYTKNFDTEVLLLEMDKHHPIPPSKLLEPVLGGRSTGIISEAGNPCIADPGFELVRFAHQKNIPVIPLVGASSILMALIASGFSGNQFAFHGYLPIPHADRIKKIKQLEEQSRRNGPQIFMETPFRNDSLLKDVLQTLNENASLCIACDITLPSQSIQTKTVKQWRTQVPELHKRYCVFVLGN